MTASRLHWRLLIATMALLVAAAFVVPRLAPAPGIEENRVLASRPARPRTLEELEHFRQAADTYVADRFPPRAHLIGLLNRVRMLAGVSGSDRVIVGRNGYLFFDLGDHMGAARGDPPMGTASTQRWLMHLAGRTEALRARGVPYLVVFAPVKETVYPRLAPPWLGRLAPQRPTVRLLQLAARSGAGEVLYLHNAVAGAERRDRPVFSRHDTHWTAYGAYAGYAALMRRLQALGVGEGPLPRSRFAAAQADLETGPKDLALMLGVARLVDYRFVHTQGEIGAPAVRITYLSAKQDWTGPQVVDTGRVGKPVLLMTRDSFSNELLPMLYPHFSRIVLAHNEEGFWRPDLVARFSPDVVVVETVEHGATIAMDAGPAASDAARARIASVAPLGPPSALDPDFRPTPASLRAVLDAARPWGRCSFDGAEMTTTDGETVVAVNGWIVTPRGRGQASDSWLRLQGPGVDRVTPISVDGRRPDVATALGAPGAARSGFRLALPAGQLDAGLYELSVYRQAPEGMIGCKTKQPLARP
jgi:hypothetical protein